MRIGQRNIDAAQHHGVPHLPPVGGDHVGGGAKARAAPELGHHFATRKAVLGPAGILGIGEDGLEAGADAHRILEQPGEKVSLVHDLHDEDTQVDGARLRR